MEEEEEEGEETTADEWCGLQSSAAPHHHQHLLQGDPTNGEFLPREPGPGHQQVPLLHGHHEDFFASVDVKDGQGAENSTTSSTTKMAADNSAGKLALPCAASATETCDSIINSDQAAAGSSAERTDLVTSGVQDDEKRTSFSQRCAEQQAHEEVSSLACGRKKDAGESRPSAKSLLPSSSSLVSTADSPPTDSGDGPNVDSSSVDPFSFFDFPSLNEVKELLPSVLKDISCMEDLSQQADLSSPPPPPTLKSCAMTPQPKTPSAGVTIIPEPKLINREESRLNLIGHIEHLQALVEERLDLVEQRLGGLELQQLLPPLDCSGIAQAIARLLNDIQSLKKANNMMPDELI